MTAHPATTQFERLAAVAPVPTARLELPTGAMPDPRKEWNATRKAFERNLRAWRSSFRTHLAEMRSLLQQSVAEIGPEKTSKIAASGTIALRKVFADTAVMAREWLDAIPEPTGRDELSTLIAGVPDLEKEYRQTVQRFIDMLVDADNRLYALELDFDPEAHRGNQFDNIDDLLADLHS